MKREKNTKKSILNRLPKAVFVLIASLFYNPSVSAENLENVITVSASGGDFTSVTSALNSISNATESNPYLIKVGPGTYSVRAQIRMKPFVTLRGSGRNLTFLTGRIRNSADSVLVSVGESLVSDLSIETIRNFNFPARAAVECLPNGPCGVLERINIRSEPHPSTPTPGVGVLLNQNDTTPILLLKDVNIVALKDQGESFGVSAIESSMRIENSRISGRTEAIQSFFGLGFSVIDSFLSGGIDFSSAFVVSSQVTISDSEFTRSGIFQFDIESVEDRILISNSFFGSVGSSDFFVDAPQIEVKGAGVTANTLNCSQNTVLDRDENRFLQLDERCNLDLTL